MHVIAVAQNTSEYVGKPEVYYDRLRKAAQSWFEEIKKVSRNMGVSEAIIATDIVTDFSSIPEAIINYASSKNADLIVMGTKGKTGLKRFLMGSVADSVVRHAYGPVFVVR
jgi:nucleotide-binding universal stress UspA family protein